MPKTLATPEIFKFLTYFCKNVSQIQAQLDKFEFLGG